MATKRKPSSAARTIHHGLLYSAKQERRLAEGTGETVPEEIVSTDADRKAVDVRRRIEDMRIEKELGLR